MLFALDTLGQGRGRDTHVEESQERRSDDFWRGDLSARVSNLEHICQGMNADIKSILATIQAEKLTTAMFMTRVIAVAGAIVTVTGFILYVLFPRVLDAILRSMGGLPKP